MVKDEGVISFRKYCPEAGAFLKGVKRYKLAWREAVSYDPYCNSSGVSHTDSNRYQFVGQFGWSIPCDEAIQTIKDLNTPILSVGSGRAYWEYCLQRAGVMITATDIVIGEGQYSHEPPKTWMPVLKIDAVKAVNKNVGGIALMMNWASYNSDWSGKCLYQYLKSGGKTLIWVGEGDGGCTGDDFCHSLIDDAFIEVNHVAIPQWDGIHDRLVIYKARES